MRYFFMVVRVLRNMHNTTILQTSHNFERENDQEKHESVQEGT